MSNLAYIARAMFIFLGLLTAIGTFALLTTDVKAAAADGTSYNCDTVLNPTTADPNRRCDPPLQTRAQGAQALGTVALGAFVAAAAVSVGGRHPITVRRDDRGTPRTSAATGYPPPGYQQPPPGYQQPPPGYQQPDTSPAPSANPPPEA